MQQKLERKAPKLARFLKEFEIQFKWLFIWLFLRLLSGPSRRRPKPIDPRRVKAVLFLRQDKIGDMVVMLPTLHTLKHHRPEITIGVLASPVNQMVVEFDRSVDKIHIYRKSLPAMIKTFREVQKVNYDMVVDLMTGTSVTSLVIAMLCSPRAYRVGIGKESFRKYYDYYTLEAMNHAKRLHITEMFRATIEPLGIPLRDGVRDGKLALSEAQQRRGAELAQQLRDPRYRGLIMLNVSAGKTDRTLSQAKFIRLVGDVSRRYPDLQFMVSYAPNELHLAKKAHAAGGENVTLLPRGVKIMELAALMPHLDAIVSVDTSVCHIAANLDVPLLAMFTGNTFNLARWHPYGRRVWVLQSPDWKAVDGITYQMLAEAVDNFIADLTRQSILQRTA